MKKKQDPEKMQSRSSNRAESCCDKLANLRPERRDAAENRQRILTVSDRLFSEQGIENVTMSQISKAAGIGQGTLYRRYANKGELCIALLKANLPQLRNEVDQYLEQTAVSTSKLGQLNSVLERLVHFIEEQLPLLGAIEDAAVKHKRGMQFRNPWYEWMHQTVSGLLNEAIAQNEILPLNTTFTADAVLATLNIDLYLFQRTDRHFTPEQILQGTRWIYIERLQQI